MKITYFNISFCILISFILIKIIGAYLEINNIYVSLLFIIQGLIGIVLFKKHSITKNNKNSKLFNLIEENQTEKFIEYVNQNFQDDIKSLENLIYYGKMNILLYAIGKKSHEICRYLLQIGYNVNFHNDFCETPLIYAIHYSDYKMVDIILEYNPDLELKSLKVNRYLNYLR